MTHIEKCPICGNEEIKDMSFHMTRKNGHITMKYAVCCPICHHTGKESTTIEGAFKAWNRKGNK